MESICRLPKRRPESWELRLRDRVGCEATRMLARAVRSAGAGVGADGARRIGIGENDADLAVGRNE